MRRFKLWGFSLVVGFWLLGSNPGYGEVIDLGTLGGLERNGVAFAINDLGEAAGYTDKSDGIVHAFLYSNGAMTDLETFGGGWNMARGINTLGQVVGYADKGEGLQRAVLYENGRMIDLGTLGGRQSFAYGLNIHG
jgi:probable HAF family extracellular repeat protein